MNRPAFRLARQPLSQVRSISDYFRSCKKNRPFFLINAKNVTLFMARLEFFMAHFARQQ